MHVPDGYLSPATVGAGYVAVAPFWAVAVARVKSFIGGRTVPLLAIFSAFTFAIMMFNVPVPGGTTAHGVGGTLCAIVLGPWAAIIATSVALIIQALFFGDGGVTAIGINCFNMGVALPMVGYTVYRIVSGKSGILTQRRVIAAAIGGYAGITAAALLVGLQLGAQPHFWSHGGVPDYSPYGFGTAIPAMLLSHMLGASFVEAAITALGVAYLQKSYPEILERRHTPSEAETSPGMNPWIPAGGLALVALVVVFVAGLFKGDGLSNWGGLDWSTVDRGDVGATVLVSAIVSMVAMPLLFFALRRVSGWRTPIMIFAGILIWVPIGLIAPGGAFGEDASASTEEVAAALQARAAGDSTLFDALPDVNKECECVPNKIDNISFSGNTWLANYQPPWVDENASPWQQNLGYQVAGLLGMGALAAIGFATFRFARWLAPSAPPDWRSAT